MKKIIIVFALVIMSGVLVGDTFGQREADNEKEQERQRIEKSVNETPSKWKHITTDVNDTKFFTNPDFMSKSDDGDFVAITYRTISEMGVDSFVFMLGYCATHKYIANVAFRGKKSADGEIKIISVDASEVVHTAKKGNTDWEVLKAGCLQ